MKNLGSKNKVQVIKSAYDECSLSSYTVTGNYRLCLGKARPSPCHLGTVTIGELRSHVDLKKCKECGMCAQGCPYDAIVHLVRPCRKACPTDTVIYDEYGFCAIDEQKCIEYGHCTRSCLLSVISAKGYLTNAIQETRAGKEVITVCALATGGQFDEKIGMGLIRNALKRIGFADMIEVDLGGDVTAAYEALEWSEARKEGKKVTISCCPTFISFSRKRFPQQYEENISMTVSPIRAVSRCLKAAYPGCMAAFIGSCAAKKFESADESALDNADYVMTYGGFSAFLRLADVQLEPEETERQEASVSGKRFAIPGGVTNTMLECMSEHGEDASEIKLLRYAGGAECKKAPQLLKLGRVAEDSIEDMTCPGGCVGGPSKYKTGIETKWFHETFLKRADDRKVFDNLENYPMEKFPMYRDRYRGLEELKRAEDEAQMVGKKR